MGFAGVGVGLLSIRYGAGVGERQGYVYTVESKSPPLRWTDACLLQENTNREPQYPEGRRAIDAFPHRWGLCLST